MQFMKICTEKPDKMADLAEIGLEPEEEPQRTPSKRGSRRGRRSNSTAPLPAPSISSSAEDALVPLTPATAKDAKPSLSTSPVSVTVTAVTRTSSRGGRSRKSPAVPKPPLIDTLAPPIPITRSASHGSRAAPASPAQLVSPLDRRSKSLKPRKRSGSTRQDAPPTLALPSGISSTAPLPPSLENVKLPEMSANRWVPSSIATRGHHSRGTALSEASVQEIEPPETVERKVKALLNKLTLEKFDSISDQIVTWANKSEAEVDGATLQLVIKLVFEKATDEATWSHMYARLCLKMMEHVSSDVRDENLKDKEGKSVAGGQLFRQYLLSRCQADFERGWSAREDLEEKQEAVVAASGAAPGEIVFSDEYYALQKAKRRGLGLVKFIGELFKLQMLTGRIMHRCILKLLDEPAEDDIESVCQLLITVGSALSGPKGKETMDQHFETMKKLAADHTVSSRIRFMLEVNILHVK
jgi:translation initiation factor 4G